MTSTRIANTTAGAHAEPLSSLDSTDLLDDPDDQAADDGALEVADAAHDRGGERDQAGREALVELHRAVVERVDQARGAGQQAAEQEGQADRAVDVDAHQAGGVGILRGGAHGLAVLGLADEVEERDQQRDGDRPGEDVRAHEVDAADVEDLLLRADQVRRRVRRRAPQQADVLQDERHPDRRDQRRQLGRVAQRPVGDALDHHVERAGADHRDREHAGAARRSSTSTRGALGDPERRVERHRDERADHEDLAVGEVDQLDDAVDERVPERDQRPDRADREPVDDVVERPDGVLDQHQQQRAAEQDPEDLCPDEVCDALARRGLRLRYGCSFHRLVARSLSGSRPARKCGRGACRT